MLTPKTTHQRTTSHGLQVTSSQKCQSRHPSNAIPKEQPNLAGLPIKSSRNPESLGLSVNKLAKMLDQPQGVPPTPHFKNAKNNFTYTDNGGNYFLIQCSPSTVKYMGASTPGRMGNGNSLGNSPEGTNTHEGHPMGAYLAQALYQNAQMAEQKPVFQLNLTALVNNPTTYRPTR